MLSLKLYFGNFLLIRIFLPPSQLAWACNANFHPQRRLVWPPATQNAIAQLEHRRKQSKNKQKNTKKQIKTQSIWDLKILMDNFFTQNSPLTY